MDQSNGKVDVLLKSSKEILLSCCLDNGAVIAADTDSPHYPKQANNYRYVWPRDAAFILYALELLGESRTERFATWLVERAEGFMDQGLFCRRYATNGATSYPQNELQPDQPGALLWSFCASRDKSSPNVQTAIKAMADHIVTSWNGQTFTKETYDLWEHHRSTPDGGQFTYTLAACEYGLRQALATHSQPNPSWAKAADSIHGLLENSDEIFTATINHDTRLDASVYGLAWPFAAVDNSDKLLRTFVKIRQELGRESGIMRFQGDSYDGEVSNGADNNKGAGTWPLLSLWEVLAYQALGQAETAKERFDTLLNRLPDDFIPEQIFDDNRQGVAPLGWAHAMFVITDKALGLIG